MKCRATKLIPKSCRIWIRGLPGLSQILDKRAARRYAHTTKRLDECLAEFARMYEATGYSLQDKVCVELGAGWVLSHALAMYVLGAKRVISTDITRLAYPDMLTIAVREAENRIDWDDLAGLGDVAGMKSRYEKLRSMETFTFKTLTGLGVEYVTPMNFAERTLGEAVDFAFSHAVLEHVPVACVRALLSNLNTDLVHGGAMYHRIDLTDHEDRNSPFAFFTQPAKAYTPAVQSGRGNRIRKSGWNSIFSELSGISFRYLADELNADAPLPETIDPSVDYTDEADLRSAYLTVWIAKNTVG